jgi:23S rRNA (uracil1939-C5)-methyltransferase
VSGRKLKPGDTVEIGVGTLDDSGAGLGEVASGQETLHVHVAGALPGERVATRLLHVSSHARAARREAWGELLSVLAASADRVPPLCPLQPECGGCAMMCLTYPAQGAWKRQRVAAYLGRYPELATSPVENCVASPLRAGYRNQAKYVYGRVPASGRLVLGAFAPRSHRIVDLAGCRVVEPGLDQVRQAVLDLLEREGVEPFDEHRRTGALRYVVMRATQSGQVMVTLVVARADWPPAQAITDELMAAQPVVASVVLNLNATTGNRIFGGEERRLAGRGFVEDRIGEVDVRLAARAFFQANRRVASCIHRDLLAAAPARVARAVDVYSGAGPIAFSLAPIADEVVAIEENAAATAVAAAFMAERGGAAGRVRLLTGDASRCLAAVASAELVVLNPPRKGCAAPVLAAVARLRPRLCAYVSCDPETLARDLAVLVAAGARLLRITPYDMMPHTPHVETLALLQWA